MDFGKIFKAIFAISLFSVIFAQTAFAANSVSVCQGDSAKFDFRLENQGDALTYSISVSGLAGTLSSNSISLDANSATTFSYSVPSQGLEIGNHPFQVTATSSRTTAVADAMLAVQKCYGSSLAISAPSSAKQCDSIPATITLSNTGTKEDSYTLSSTGALPISFSQNPATVAAGASKQVAATITIPCTQTPATVASQTITSAGKTTSSASFQLQVLAKPTPTPTPSPSPAPTPIPTPKPAGCAYSNPACAEGFECKDNNCYKTIVVNNTITVNNTVIVTVTPIPTPTPMPTPVKTPAPTPEPEPMLLLGSIRVCKNESAKMNFDLYNPKQSDATFELNATGAEGTLSATTIVAKPDSKASFWFLIDAALLEPNRTYLLAIAAKEQGAKTQYIGARVLVEDCFATNLSVTGAYSLTTQQSPEQNAAPMPSLEAQATASPSPSSTLAPAQSALQQVSINSEGALSLEIAAEKELQVEITNNGATAIENASLFLSGAVLSNSVLPAIAPNSSTTVLVKISGQKEGAFASQLRVVGGKTLAEKNISIYVSKPLLSLEQKQTTVSQAKIEGNKTAVNSTTTVTLKNAGGKLDAQLELLGAQNSALSNKTIALERGKSAEIKISALFAEGAKEQNATLLVKSNRGTYAFPIILSPKPAASILTGLFTAATGSWPYLAVIAIAVFAYFKIFKAKPADAEEGEEEKEEGKKSKKK